MIEVGPGGPAPATAAQPPRWKRRVRRVGLLIGLLAAATAPFWGRPALSELDFFRLTRVEVRGARYASADEIVSRLGLDSTASVWDDVEPVAQRAREHPSVRDVRIRRQLPGTLVLEVTENPPVALVQAAGALVPVDDSGRTLPVDPTVVSVDLPVLRTRDTLSLRLLGEVRAALPSLYSRIGDVRRGADGGVQIRFDRPSPRLVIAAPGVTTARLAEIVAVEQDLMRRGVAASELDLRFKDQVIARIP
ncbi:MAG: FtsQ-type POTRA domain-containing protein [Gemmatimonadetes bacterium]|nr:FtsQ-type POTRA domain-containing protein [Gemmatimonadota bacterium]